MGIRRGGGFVGRRRFRRRFHGVRQVDQRRARQYLGQEIFFHLFAARHRRFLRRRCRRFRQVENRRRIRIGGQRRKLIIDGRQAGQGGIHLVGRERRRRRRHRRRVAVAQIDAVAVRADDHQIVPLAAFETQVGEGNGPWLAVVVGGSRVGPQETAQLGEFRQHRLVRQVRGGRSQDQGTATAPRPASRGRRNRGVKRAGILRWYAGAVRIHDVRVPDPRPGNVDDQFTAP